jgi:hypothetical protein
MKTKESGVFVWIGDRSKGKEYHSSMDCEILKDYEELPLGVLEEKAKYYYKLKRCKSCWS